jgi:hypothetical protein
MPTAAILLPAFHEAIPVRKTDEDGSTHWNFEDESSTIYDALDWPAERRQEFYHTILKSLSEGKTKGESQGLVWELDPDFNKLPSTTTPIQEVEIAVTLHSYATVAVGAPPQTGRPLGTTPTTSASQGNSSLKLNP